MKSVRLTALMLLALGFSLLTSPATAQTPPVGSAPTLPQALSSLIMITYACQAVSGPELYSHADDLARKVTLRMTGDQSITSQFMQTAEDHARAACPNSATCWHELLDAGQVATPVAGKAACQTFTENAAHMVADLVTHMSGDTKPESGS